MRKFIICLFALFICGNATAETMCVKFPENIGADWRSGDYKSNWEISSTDVVMTGIGYCSSQQGFHDQSGDATKSDNLTISGTPEENTKCWCKMLSPAVSSWAFAYNYYTAGECAKSCAYNCALAIGHEELFVEILFSDLH